MKLRNSLESTWKWRNSLSWIQFCRVCGVKQRMEKRGEKRGGSLNWFFPVLWTSQHFRRAFFTSLQFIGFPDEFFSVLLSIPLSEGLEPTLRFNGDGKMFKIVFKLEFTPITGGSRVFCVFLGHWARFSTFCISISTQLFIFDSIKIKFTRQLLCSSFAACIYFSYKYSYLSDDLGQYQQHLHQNIWTLLKNTHEPATPIHFVHFSLSSNIDSFKKFLKSQIGR